MGKFLTKVRRYGGKLAEATSVLAIHDTLEEAQAHANRWNTDYQTDTAYAEEWDDEKFDWPDMRDWKRFLDE